MIKTKRGLASEIRSTIDVSGGGQSGIFVSTKHIALFKIDNLPIKVISKQPPIIQEGDEVIVSGSVKNGQFVAEAYYNISTSSKGSRGYISKFIGAAILIVLGAFFWFYIPNDLGIITKIIAAFFASIGFYYLYRGLNILQAIKNIDNIDYVS